MLPVPPDYSHKDADKFGGIASSNHDAMSIRNLISPDYSRRVLTAEWRLGETGVLTLGIHRHCAFRFFVRSRP